MREAEFHWTLNSRKISSTKVLIANGAKGKNQGFLAKTGKLVRLLEV
jgi:hypothetical protein